MEQLAIKVQRRPRRAEVGPRTCLIRSEGSPCRLVAVTGWERGVRERQIRLLVATGAESTVEIEDLAEVKKEHLFESRTLVELVGEEKGELLLRQSGFSCPGCDGDGGTSTSLDYEPTMRDGLPGGLWRIYQVILCAEQTEKFTCLLLYPSPKSQFCSCVCVLPCSLIMSSPSWSFRLVTCIYTWDRTCDSLPSIHGRSINASGFQQLKLPSCEKLSRTWSYA